ncbi:hypothetical protein E2C01_091816 [Portunus trituberculatus]|uniref:Uncharacterized protein n=1 Tax=Portunus trituberculatus TaxID=210409 RepID=A0A5B7JK12_PORTR|nr:hypothetical protein [Portunus trituberculatus]
MEDALSFMKRSWAEVMGSVRPASLSLPLAQDPDVAMSVILEPLAHLRPVGEGQTAYGDTEPQVHPAAQPKGGGVQEMAPCHPSLLSMKPKGVGGGSADGNLLGCASSPLFGCTTTFSMATFALPQCVALTHLSVFLPPLIPPCRWMGIGNRSVGKRRTHHLPLKKRDLWITTHSQVLNQIRVHPCRKGSTFINASPITSVVSPGQILGK